MLENVTSIAQVALALSALGCVLRLVRVGDEKDSALAVHLLILILAAFVVVLSVQQSTRIYFPMLLGLLPVVWGLL